MANVFGALNRFIARLDADPQASSPANSGVNHGYGFQVLRNTKSLLPVEPWFDYIIGINGRTIDNPSPELFSTEVRNCAGSTVSFGVFSAKGSQIREVFASIPTDASGLGLALQWTPLNLANDIWHITDIIPNSPADVAGLLPYSDYVIGSPDSPFLHGESALGQLVEAYMDRPLRLHVYNQEYDVTRVVTITPARNWGGEGALGCVLGYGFAHRLPAVQSDPTPQPGQTLFDSTSPAVHNLSSSTTNDAVAYDGSQSDGPALLVPANLTFHTASSTPASSLGIPPSTNAGASGGTTGAGGPPQGRPRKARAHPSHGPAATGGLDDYFAEGEQKSRELDRGTSATPKASLPPPPKAGTATGPPPPTGAAASQAESNDVD